MLTLLAVIFISQIELPANQEETIETKVERMWHESQGAADQSTSIKNFVEDLGKLLECEVPVWWKSHFVEFPPWWKDKRIVDELRHDKPREAIKDIRISESALPPGYSLQIDITPFKTTVYTFAPEQPLNPTTSHVVINEKTILILDTGEGFGPINCYLLNRSDGKLLWENKVSTTRSTSYTGSTLIHRVQAVDNGKEIVVFGYARSCFYGFKLGVDSGSIIWKFHFFRAANNGGSLFLDKDEAGEGSDRISELLGGKGAGSQKEAKDD